MAANAPKNRPGDLFADPSINYRLAPGDVLAQCTYCPQKVRDTKLANHLSKCRTQYLKYRSANPKLPNIIICKGNYTHHIVETELEEHYKLCAEAQEQILRQKEHEEAMASFQTDVTETVETETKNNEEGDDDDDAFDVDAASVGHSFSSSCASFQRKEPDIKATPTDMEMEWAAFNNSDAATMSSNVSVFSSVDESPPKPQPKSKPVDFFQFQPQGRQRTQAVPEDWESEMSGARGWSTRVNNSDPKKHQFYIPAGMSKAERKSYRNKMTELSRSTVQSSHPASAYGIKRTIKEEEGIPEDDFTLPGPAPEPWQPDCPRRRRRRDQEDYYQGITPSFAESAYDYDCDKPKPSPTVSCTESEYKFDFDEPFHPANSLRQGHGRGHIRDYHPQ